MKPQGRRTALTQAQKAAKRRIARGSGAKTNARKKRLTDALDQFFKPLR